MRAIAGIVGVLVALPWAAALAMAGGASPPARGAAVVTAPPAGMLELFRHAVATQCPQLPWTVLAAISQIESSHGTSSAAGVSSGANSAGAEGPMQFEPGTWARYGDGGDIYSVTDAVPAAARLLCANGGDTIRGLPGAVFAYNHSPAYVDDVLALADEYRIAYGS
jgi:hypothetical protein